MTDAMERAPETGLSMMAPGSLAAAIDPDVKKAIEQKKDDWYVPEEPPVAYSRIRQKDLRDAKGTIIRGAGFFRFGKVDDLSTEDVKELKLTIFAYHAGRVYYPDLDAAEPTCDSRDAIHGSRPAEQVGGKMVYGQCATCWLSQRGSGPGGEQEGRKACKENRAIFALNLATETPVVLTIGPSSLKNFAKYEAFISSESARVFGPQSLKSLHHLVSVTAALEYKSEPAGHYVVVWKDVAPLPPAMQKLMENLKDKAVSRLDEVLNKQPIEREDYEATPGATVSGPQPADPGDPGPTEAPLPF